MNADTAQSGDPMRQIFELVDHGRMYSAQPPHRGAAGKAVQYLDEASKSRSAFIEVNELRAVILRFESTASSIVHLV